MPSEPQPDPTDPLDYVRILGALMMDASFHGREFELADRLLSAVSFLVKRSGAADENALWATGALAERSGLTEPGAVRH